MSTIPTNRESDRFMLRLPDGMRDRIKAAAEANNRSMNAEIVARLSNEGSGLTQVLPPSLFYRISLEAAYSRRSVEAEMIAALEERFPTPPEVEENVALSGMVKMLESMIQIFSELPDDPKSSEKVEMAQRGLSLFKSASPSVARMVAHRIMSDLLKDLPEPSPPKVKHGSDET